MKICPSCAAFLPAPARRMCRTPQVHNWYTPAERDALPPHVRDVVVSVLMRRGILAVAVLLVLLVGVGCVEKKSTPTKWDGIPEKRVCSYVHSYQHSLITCIADGKVYVCIQDEGYHVLCTRDTVEIKCTNIVNVETVCPGKP